MNVGAIILAGGKGKRMQSTTVNKVTLPLGGKPMIAHTMELLKKLNVGSIVVVVGFAKESVQEALHGFSVTFAVQEEQLGTAHAVKIALDSLPSTVTDVLVLQGDDSAFYTPEGIQNLLKKHEERNSAITLLTLELENPIGLGRIVRNDQGEIEKIIEEKDATGEEKLIKEINPACYIFSIQFLKKYIPKIEKSPVTGEYYLTSLIDLAISNHETIEVVLEKKTSWRGVNTPEELQIAQDLYASKTI